MKSSLLDRSVAVIGLGPIFADGSTCPTYASVRCHGGVLRTCRRLPLTLNTCDGQGPPGTTGLLTSLGSFVHQVPILDPGTQSVGSEFSNERSTVGMFGAGRIEMVAREMSEFLQAPARDLDNGERILVS